MTDPLAESLVELRARTLSLLVDLDDEQWRVPHLPIVNPFGWELGHVGWFAERWVLREALGRPPLRADGDAWWDSSAVAHAARWSLPLPDRAGTLGYVAEVLEQVLAALDDRPVVRYHARYALLHEAMHAEAFTYMRHTLGYPAPAAEAPLVAGPWPGDVEVPAGVHRLGAEPDAAFAFDNEKWAHPVPVDAFRIDRAPVTVEAFAAFVADGGYRRRELWDPAAPVWDGPADWRGGLRRRFDRQSPPELNHPIDHVSWFEADAYAR
ncbi:MAG: SUMF1/EgtB/PvdO family nonheme iron enzyme, partial [Myxococcota bacterium]